MTSSDRFPVPVRSAVKSNLTDWCFQNLSKRALNALTVQASTTRLSVFKYSEIELRVYWSSMESSGIQFTRPDTTPRDYTVALGLAM